MSVKMLCDGVCREEIALLADITQITYHIISYQGMSYVGVQQQQQLGEAEARNKRYKF